MKKFITTIIATIGLSLIPSAAFADYGYACQVHQYNYSGFGSDGGIQVYFYSGPNCTGSFQKTLYVCSGGTHAVCAASSYYNYDGLQLQTIYSSLVESAHSGNRIYYNTSTSCQSSGTDCLQTVRFRGD